jgi:hypothetical protein
MTEPASLEASLHATFAKPVVLGAGETGDALNGLLRALEMAGGEKFIVSILMLNTDETTLHCLAAPSLPKAYCDAIDGSPIGPKAGSCGTAAYYGHPIFVSDIATDEYWEDYKDLAAAHGLAACWSIPVIDWRGKVIATFAVYHRYPTSPTVSERDAIGHAAVALGPMLASLRV